MTISVKMLNDEIRKISDTNTLLDMLLEFEKVLEDMDLYAYENWMKGEVLEGPTLDRHFVTVKLMYKQDEMPDPRGAMRLLDARCLVKYTEEKLITPVRVKSFDDVSMQARPDGTFRQKPKRRLNLCGWWKSRCPESMWMSSAQKLSRLTKTAMWIPKASTTNSKLLQNNR